MRQPLLAAVAAGFIGACGVSVATSQEAPARDGGAVAARERPAPALAGLRELAPLPALRRREPRPARVRPARDRAPAPQAAPIVAASPPAAPAPVQQPVTTPAPAPTAPAPSPAPEFDSSEEVFDSSG